MGEEGDNTTRTSIIPSFGFPPVLFPNEYVWFVFFSSMDVLLTWAILAAGGSEVNPVAERIIMMWGLNGAITFKFGLTLFVIVVCEIAGRKRDLTTGAWTRILDTVRGSDLWAPVYASPAAARQDPIDGTAIDFGASGADEEAFVENPEPNAGLLTGLGLLGLAARRYRRR